MYRIHDSEELCAIFTKKPYQGQSPDKAAVIVFGTDANYSPEISGHPFFKRIIEYHEDGVAFWQRRGVHHPFLLDEYPFHKGKGGVGLTTQNGNPKLMRRTSRPSPKM
jgi:hypothetical protein